MFLKLTRFDGLVIRVNMAIAESYRRENGMSLTMVDLPNMDVAIQVKETPEQIDRLFVTQALDAANVLAEEMLLSTQTPGDA